VLLTTLPAFATFPGKNGRIAFVQDGEIFTMNPDGSDIRQLTHLGLDISANWPFGLRTVERSSSANLRAPDRKPEIWVMDADGSNQHWLFAEKLFDEHRASFPPDGSKTSRREPFMP